MGFNDINLQVSGPQQPASIYKTKVLKGQVPFATQVTEPNTKYVIKHNFVLDADVTIPSNCILEFDGGSVNGAYTLTGSNTGIQAGLVKIFDTDVILAGTWNVTEAYPEWFGAKADGVTNDSEAISKSLWFKTVVLQGRTYKLNSKLSIGSRVHFKGQGLRSTILDFSDCSDTEAVSMSGFGSRISNLKITTSNNVENQIGVKSSYATEWSNLENVVIEGFYHGMYVNECWYNSFKNVKIQHPNSDSEGYALIIGDLNERITRPEVNQVSFISCSFGGYRSNIILSNVSIKACTFITCAIERCRKEAIVTNNESVFGPMGELSLIDPYFETNNLDKADIPDGGFDCINVDITKDININVFGGRWSNNFNNPSKWSFGNRYNLYGRIHTSSGFIQKYDETTHINLYGQHSGNRITNGTTNSINGVPYDYTEQSERLSVSFDNSLIPTLDSYCIGYITYTGGSFAVVSKILARADSNQNYSFFVFNNKADVAINSQSHIGNRQANEFKVYSSKFIDVHVRFALDATNKRLYVYIHNKTTDGVKLGSLELSLLSRGKGTFTFTKEFKQKSQITGFDSFLKDVEYYPVTPDEANRPTLDVTFTGVSVFQIDINKPIWWNGSAWVDVTGATV